jgi:hypothetical protein
MLFRHQHSLVPPLNTVLPTISGNLINGQVLTGSVGTWTGAYVETQYRWKSASAPYGDSDYSVIGGASAITFTQTATEIGKRIIFGARRRGRDGWSPWAESAPTNIVQDSPTLPVAISGTPITSVYQNSPYSFTVSALNGVPNASPPFYTFSLGGTWPSGATITPNANGDQATISGPFSSSGTYGGLTVNVLDSAANSNSLDTFSLVVVASNALKVTPGSGWTASTTGATNLGSPSGIGYGYSPGMWWAEPQHDELTGIRTFELIALHSGDQSALNAVNNPTFGMNYVEFSVDNGPWVQVNAAFDPTTNRYSYKIKVDPADFADGAPVTSGTIRRELRARGYPRNGNVGILQGDPVGYGNVGGLRFTTNSGGTLTIAPTYVDGTSGNDTTGNGTSGSPYKTPAKAVAAIAAANGGSPGGGTLYLKDGNYALTSLSAGNYTDNNRYLVIRPWPGNSNVNITGNNSGGLRYAKTRFKDLNWKICYVVADYHYVLMENITIDLGSANLRNADMPAPVYNGYGRAHVTYIGGSLTNCLNGPISARLVKDHACLTIGSDSYQSTWCVINSTADQFVEGVSTGQNGGGQIHGDLWQVQAPGANWYWGGLLYNVTANTGRLSGQGPFFANSLSWNNMFMINVDVKVPVGRNAMQLSDGAMRNGLFWNLKVVNGNNRWLVVNASSDDIVGVDLQMINLSPNGTLPGVTILTRPS